MIDERTFIGSPTQFKNLCLIYPPKVSDVINTSGFAMYKQLLTITQEDIEDDFVEKGVDLKELLTPMEYILNISYNNKDYEIIAKKAFSFFIKEEVHFLYDQKMIVIGDLTKDLQSLTSINQLRLIRESDYFDFQNAIRQSLGEKPVEPPNPEEDPRIKRMKAKARYRDKIKAKKEGLPLSTILASICCMGIGITPLNVGELSYGAVSFLIQTCQEKEKYETDIQSLLAGASSKDVQPKYWIRKFDE